MALIEAKKLSKHFTQGGKLIKAVDGVDLTVSEAEFLLIVGVSGSGKSTLMQLMGALDSPTSGQIIVDGNDLGKLKESQRTELRQKKFGFVFQNFNLIPTLTAAENVEVAISHRSKNDQQRVRQVLEQVGLTSRAHHLPTLMSGGEQQRVAIARALINDPPIIFADEPTGNLDSKTTQEVLTILKDLNQKRKKTVIMITHADFAHTLATRVERMHDGKLNQEPI